MSNKAINRKASRGMRTDRDYSRSYSSRLTTREIRSARALRNLQRELGESWSVDDYNSER